MQAQLANELLNLYQSTEELDRVYTSNYYHYLNSQPFKDVFLKPMGKFINNLKPDSVLDVACGEGQLAEFIQASYWGFDGSNVAIARAQAAFPSTPERRRSFAVNRLETVHLTDTKAQFDTIVFGGVFSVLVKDPVHFIDLYVKRFQPRHFVIYDLQTFDEWPVMHKYDLRFSYFASVDMPGLQEVKKHRKFSIYRA